MAIRISAWVVLGMLAACRVPDPDVPGDLRPRGHSLFTLQVGWSGGDVALATKGTTADGEVTGEAFRAMLEGREAKLEVGFGAEGFLYSSDKGLLGAGGDSRQWVTDGFIYMYFPIGSGDSFTMPLRIGPVYQEIELDSTSGTTPVNVTWEQWGARVAIEPEVRLLYSEELCWSVFAGGYYGLAAADIEVSGVPRTFDAAAQHAGGEFGTRWEIGRFLIGVSWVERRSVVDRSDSSGTFVVPGIESEFDGVMITGGLRF